MHSMQHKMHLPCTHWKYIPAGNILTSAAILRYSGTLPSNKALNIASVRQPCNNRSKGIISSSIQIILSNSSCEYIVEPFVASRVVIFPPPCRTPRRTSIASWRLELVRVDVLCAVLHSCHFRTIYRFLSMKANINKVCFFVVFEI